MRAQSTYRYLSRMTGRMDGNPFSTEKRSNNGKRLTENYAVTTLTARVGFPRTDNPRRRAADSIHQ